MIKLIRTVRYQDGRAFEECHRYFLERRGPAVRDVAGVRRYTQSHRLSEVTDIGNATYDAFESLWFDNEQVAQQVLASTPMTALDAQAAAYVDPAGSRQILAREIVLRDLPEQHDAVKLVAFNHRRPELSPESFSDYWETRHGPLVLAKFGALRRYVQNHACPSSYAAGQEPAFDGVLEGWLESLEAFRAGIGTADSNTVRADEANFLDTSRFSSMLVRDQQY